MSPCFQPLSAFLAGFLMSALGAALVYFFCCKKRGGAPPPHERPGAVHKLLSGPDVVLDSAVARDGIQRYRDAASGSHKAKTIKNGISITITSPTQGSGR
ncbi:MAG: hypothetical protein QM642_10915 [Edaphocola sp.]